jgi:hypothetical protein
MSHAYLSLVLVPRGFSQWRTYIEKVKVVFCPQVYSHLALASLTHRTIGMHNMFERYGWPGGDLGLFYFAWCWWLVVGLDDHSCMGKPHSEVCIIAGLLKIIIDFLLAHAHPPAPHVGT